MNRIGIIALALALAPAVASAQEGPPGAPAPDAPPLVAGPGVAGGPNGAAFAAMRKTRGQIEAIRKQARAQILGALTPDQRTLLASVVGGLAVSDDPDLRAAAKQLDAALSPAESQAILDAERHLHDQTRAAMEAARQQFEASLPAARRAQIDARMAARKGNEQNGSRHEWKPDAGRALLEVALDFGRPPHRFGAPGGQPPGPQ